jgi:hypothetical protein
MPSAAPPIPELVKHMTIAVLDKGTGDFDKCFTIAKSRCVTYDLIGPVAEDIDGIIKLTTKGEASERKHRADLGSRTKTIRFDQLYQLWYEEKVRLRQLHMAGQPSTAPAPIGLPQQPPTHRQGILDKLRDAELRSHRDRE